MQTNVVDLTYVCYVQALDEVGVPLLSTISDLKKSDEGVKKISAILNIIKTRCSHIYCTSRP